MQWQPIATAPRDTEVIVWARKVGFPEDKFRWRAASFLEARTCTINGERAPGWLSLDGWPGYYEDTGSYLDADDLLATHWMIPEPPEA